MNKIGYEIQEILKFEMVTLSKNRNRRKSHLITELQQLLAMTTCGIPEYCACSILHFEVLHSVFLRGGNGHRN